MFCSISIFIALLLCLAVSVYLWLRKRYRYWSDKGVEGPNPHMIFGNMHEMITSKHSTGTQFKILYEKTKHLPYVGIYLFFRPALLINSLEMVKTIFIRDFAHFTDHGPKFDNHKNPLVNNLFNVTGTRWKTLRNKLTPAFTSSKMKYMFNTMMNCNVELREYFKQHIKTTAVIDIKEVMAKFSTDVIVSCAYGIETNSFKDPNNEFRMNSKKIFDFDFMRSMAFFLSMCAPDLQKIIKLPLFELSLSRFFIKEVDKTIKYREENNIVRDDLMQLMIRIKNNESIEDKEESSDVKENAEVDNTDLAGIAFGFYAGGLDTSATTMSFIFYELAKNKDVQEKLRSEIYDAISHYDGDIPYETLNSMTYMYQVIEECLRLHSPTAQLIRICTKDYVLPGTNSRIAKGTPVFIPTYGIHMDSEIYPQPEKFDPERFSVENKATRSNLSLLAFGEGPRMCIGNRFAIMQIRIAMYTVLKDYDVSLVNDNPLQLTKNSFIIQPKDVFVKLTKINK